MGMATGRWESASEKNIYPAFGWLCYSVYKIHNMPIFAVFMRTAGVSRTYGRCGWPLYNSAGIHVSYGSFSYWLMDWPPSLPYIKQSVARAVIATFNFRNKIATFERASERLRYSLCREVSASEKQNWHIH